MLLRKQFVVVFNGSMKILIGRLTMAGLCLFGITDGMALPLLDSAIQGYMLYPTSKMTQTGRLGMITLMIGILNPEDL